MRFSPWFSLCVVMGGACSTPEMMVVDADVADMGAVDADTHGGLLLPECESMEPTGQTALALVPSTLVATIVPMSPRLSMNGPLNPATEEGEAMYSSMGYNLYSAGAGQDRVRLNTLGDTTEPVGERHSLAWFVHYSDFQLADDESPLRVAAIDNPTLPGGLRAQESMLTRVIAAFNRTFARIESVGHPYDFGIITGDCSDSAQRNELRWVIESMNGNAGIHVDSGEDDDPIPGPDNDPKDAYDGTTFPAPWLFVPGNHDVESVGFGAITEQKRMQALSTIPPAGTRDYRRWFAPVTTNLIPADPEREILDRDDIVAALRADTSGPGPAGHGYSLTDDPDYSLGANYEYDAIPGLLRIVALDTSDVSGGSNGLVTQATLDNFLIPALDRAVEDHMLVIIASHHPTSEIDTRSDQDGAVMPGAVEGADIETLVAGRPEVIAWLVGHVHDNRVRAIAGPDATHPGYWEIMSSAVADFPSQQRAIEIVDNGNSTLSIFATLIDYDTESCMERRFRRLTQIEYLSAWCDNVSGDPEDLNVDLVIAVPTSAAASVAAASATAPTQLESETTLRGL